MASLKEHCEECSRDLGVSFERVHLWLDELQGEYGPMHRPFRHHVEGIERVRAMWGDQAAAAAEIHIRRDCGGVILSQRELREYWGIEVEKIAPDDLEY